MRDNAIKMPSIAPLRFDGVPWDVPIRRAAVPRLLYLLIDGLRFSYGTVSLGGGTV